MNRKGFMMAELVVVSAVVLVALTGLYASYNKVISLYNQRINYYDVPTLYRLAFLKDKNTYSGMINVHIEDFEGAEVDYENVCFITKNDLNNIKDAVNNCINSEINPTFKDYLNYLSTSLVDIRGEDMLLIMEKCPGVDNKSNCKYAYLDVEEVNHEL